MINKLHKLKQTQLNQQLMLKKQLLNKIDELDKKIADIQNSLNSSGVERFGAIGDFKILAIHKDSMKFEKMQLQNSKKGLLDEVEKINLKIVQHQKDVEKYSYILKQQLKEKMKEEQKAEEMVASEYIQSKYIQKMVRDV